MPYKNRLFTAIIVTIIFFISGEACVRLMGWKEKTPMLQFSSDPDIRWAPTPNYEGRHDSELELIKLNSQGLRDYEHAFEKPKNTFRIFIIGECTVFGIGVLASEIFTKQLEAMLNERPIFNNFNRYEVISAGIVQWDDLQKVAYAQKYGLKYNPDLIILSHDIGTKGWFDFFKVFMRYRKIGDIIPKSSRFMRYLYRKSGKYLRKMLDFRIRIEHDSYGEINYILRLYKEDSLYWEESKKALKKLSRLSEDKGMPVMVVFFPWLNFLEESPYPFEKVGESYNQVCRKYNIPFLNLTNYFLNKDPEQFWPAKGVPGPPNKFAHRIIAEKIYDFLRTELLNKPI